MAQYSPLMILSMKWLKVDGMVSGPADDDHFSQPRIRDLCLHMTIVAVKRGYILTPQDAHALWVQHSLASTDEQTYFLPFPDSDDELFAILLATGIEDDSEGDGHELFN